MTALTRRSSLTLIAGGVAALGTQTPAAEAAVKTFVAFGDSYTRTYRAGIPTWADQINASGAAKILVDLAVSGSFAAGSNSATTLDGQVDRWIGTYKSRGVPDRTVIYMGNNDVGFGGSLTTAMNQYRVQVDRLIANRVTYGSRRLVLCLLHDWSRNPSSTTSVRSRVRWWNDHLASIAAARPNVVTVEPVHALRGRFRPPARSTGWSTSRHPTSRFRRQPTFTSTASTSAARATPSSPRKWCRSCSRRASAPSAPTPLSGGWLGRRGSLLFNSVEFIFAVLADHPGGVLGRRSALATGRPAVWLLACLAVLLRLVEPAPRRPLAARRSRSTTASAWHLGAPRTRRAGCC